MPSAWDRYLRHAELFPSLIDLHQVRKSSDDPPVVHQQSPVAVRITLRSIWPQNMRVGGDTHGGNAENKNVHTPGIWELKIVVRILDTGDLTMPLLLYGNQRAKLGPFAKPCHTSSICTLLGNLHFIQSWADSKIARRRRIFFRILGWQNTIL